MGQGGEGDINIVKDVETGVMRIMKTLRDSHILNNKDKFWGINTLLMLQHENIMEIDDVLYTDDNKLKDICFTMNFAQYGDLMKWTIEKVI